MSSSIRPGTRSASAWTSDDATWIGVPVTVELVLLSGVPFRGKEITGSGPRGLLASLAGELRTGCGTARLVDGLWPVDRPEHPVKTLQLVVSRARARLGPGVILSTPTGYRLALAESQVDASAVRSPVTAIADRDEALAMPLLSSPRHPGGRVWEKPASRRFHRGFIAVSLLRRASA